MRRRFIAALARVLGALSDITAMNDGLDSTLVLLYALAWLSVIGTAATAWIALRFWRRGTATRWSRIHHGAIALAAIVLSSVRVAWRVAGTTLNY